MDPERPDTNSIFNRPDPEIEDLADVPPASADRTVDDWTHHQVRPAADQPIRPPEAPLAPRRPPARPPSGPSRTALAAIGGGGVVILALVGFIVVTIMGGDGTPAALDATPTATASAAPTSEASEDASPSASPTPTPKAAEAVRLSGGQWATVTLDVVNVRSQPSLDGSLVGSANRGEIVYILDDDREQADGMTWYRAITAPGVAGWMAGHTAVDQYITPDRPTTSVRWCAVPDGAAFEVEEPTHMGGGATTLLDTAHIGGLPVATALLGPAGSGIVELAWGTQDQVCLDLAITDGRASAIGLSTSIEGCGSLYYGGSLMLQFGTSSVGPGGETDSRRAVLDPTVIGYDYTTAGQRPNLADVFQLASSGGVGEQALCVTASASGAATSPSIAFEAGTTQCAWVSSRTSSTVTLNYPNSDGEWVELRLTPGSFVGDGVTAQSHSYGAEKGFRVSAERGVDGSLGISVRALEGCGS